MKKVMKVLVKAGVVYLVCDGVFWMVLGIGDWLALYMNHPNRDAFELFDASVEYSLNGYKMYGKAILKRIGLS